MQPLVEHHLKSRNISYDQYIEFMESDQTNGLEITLKLISEIMCQHVCCLVSDYIWVSSEVPFNQMGLFFILKDGKFSGCSRRNGSPLLIHYDALMHEGDQQIVTGTLVADLSAELYSSPPTDQDSFHNIFYEDCMLRVRSDIWEKWKKVQMVIADNLFKYSTESNESGNTELHLNTLGRKMLKTKPNENHMFEAIRCQLSVVDGRTYTTTCMRYQIVQYLQNDGHHLIAKITELLEKRNMTVQDYYDLMEKRKTSGYEVSLLALDSILDKAILVIRDDFLWVSRNVPPFTCPIVVVMGSGGRFFGTTGHKVRVGPFGPIPLKKVKRIKGELIVVPDTPDRPRSKKSMTSTPKTKSSPKQSYVVQPEFKGNILSPITPIKEHDKNNQQMDTNDDTPSLSHSPSFADTMNKTIEARHIEEAKFDSIMGHEVQDLLPKDQEGRNGNGPALFKLAEPIAKKKSSEKDESKSGPVSSYYTSDTSNNDTQELFTHTPSESTMTTNETSNEEEHNLPKQQEDPKATDKSKENNKEEKSDIYSYTPLTPQAEETSVEANNLLAGNGHPHVEDGNGQSEDGKNEDKSEVLSLDPHQKMHSEPPKNPSSEPECKTTTESVDLAETENRPSTDNGNAENNNLFATGSDDLPTTEIQQKTQSGNDEEKNLTDPASANRVNSEITDKTATSAAGLSEEEKLRREMILRDELIAKKTQLKILLENLEKRQFKVNECNTCKEVFKDDDDYYKHILKTHRYRNRKRHPPVIINITFTPKEALHRFDEMNESLECPICEQVQFSHNTARRHMEKEHPEIGMSYCHACPYMYFENDGLQLHLAMVHSDYYEETYNEYLVEKVMKAEEKSSRSPKSQTEANSSNPEDKSSRSPKGQTAGNNSNSADDFQSPNRRDKRKRRRKTNWGHKKKHSTSQEQLSSIDKGNTINEEVPSQDETPMRCPICRKGFTAKSSFNFHIEKGHNPDGSLRSIFDHDPNNPNETLEEKKEQLAVAIDSVFNELANKMLTEMAYKQEDEEERFQYLRLANKFTLDAMEKKKEDLKELRLKRETRSDRKRRLSTQEDNEREPKLIKEDNAKDKENVKPITSPIKEYEVEENSPMKSGDVSQRDTKPETSPIKLKETQDTASAQEDTGVEDTEIQDRNSPKISIPDGKHSPKSRRKKHKESSKKQKGNTDKKSTHTTKRKSHKDSDDDDYEKVSKRTKNCSSEQTEDITDVDSTFSSKKNKVDTTNDGGNINIKPLRRSDRNKREKETDKEHEKDEDSAKLNKGKKRNIGENSDQDGKKHTSSTDKTKHNDEPDEEDSEKDGPEASVRRSKRLKQDNNQERKKHAEVSTKKIKEEPRSSPERDEASPDEFGEQVVRNTPKRPKRFSTKLPEGKHDHKVATKAKKDLQAEGKKGKRVRKNKDEDKSWSPTRLPQDDQNEGNEQERALVDEEFVRKKKEKLQKKYKGFKINGGREDNAPYLFRCDRCEESFPSQEKYNKHKKKCGGSNKKFSCKTCHQRFHEKAMMEQHYSFHHTKDDPMFICYNCKVIFVYKKALTNHNRRKHPDEDSHKFVCDQCGKSYVQEWEFKQHRRTSHTDLRPYACGICQQKSFSSTSQLNAHLKVCGAPKKYECKDCGKKFASQGNFLTHVAGVHRGKKFPCAVCDKKYSSKGGMYKHMRVIHHIGAKEDLTLKQYLMDYEEDEEKPPIVKQQVESDAESGTTDNDSSDSEEGESSEEDESKDNEGASSSSEDEVKDGGQSR